MPLRPLHDGCGSGASTSHRNDGQREQPDSHRNRDVCCGKRHCGKEGVARRSPAAGDEERQKRFRMARC